VKWGELPDYDPYEGYLRIFNAGNVGKESYFDKMTHFDFKTLLPALLQVEDRMSMAFSLESRVPFLDTKVVELAASMPADVKFKDGNLKMILQDTMRDMLCQEILDRKTKMGFPVPFSQWIRGPIRDFVYENLGSTKARSRGFLNSEIIVDSIAKEGEFSRNLWGVLSLELWHQNFIDNSSKFSKMLD
jgi:asparagine synthase (glutamine-hydrolysing)